MINYININYDLVVGGPHYFETWTATSTTGGSSQIAKFVDGQTIPVFRVHRKYTGSPVWIAQWGDATTAIELQPGCYEFGIDNATSALSDNYQFNIQIQDQPAVAVPFNDEDVLGRPVSLVISDEGASVVETCRAWSASQLGGGQHASLHHSQRWIGWLIFAIGLVLLVIIVMSLVSKPGSRWPLRIKVV